MSNLNLLETISKLENVQLQISTSATKLAGEDKFVTSVTFGQFNPEVMVNNGGPVTTKGLTFNTLGDTFEEAEGNALKKIIVFMNLGE